MDIKKIHHLEDEKIKQIGHAFGYYDYSDNEKGVIEFFKNKDSVAFYISQYVRMALKSDSLYSIGNDGEGYIGIYYSDSKISIRAMWELIKGFIKSMSLSVMFKMAKEMSRAGMSLSDKMKKKKEKHIFVGLVCVSEKYQGMGYMRKLLEYVFAKGQAENLPVVLDTDAKSKCDKYVHLGMELACTRECSNGVIMYDLVKYPDGYYKN